MTANALDIVIVGAGLGGLCAAFRLAQDGHNVTLYERNASFNPKGGAIMIRPNASRFLQEWGLGPQFQAISDETPASNYRSGFSGEILLRRQPFTAASGHPDWGTFRDAAQRVFIEEARILGATIEFGVTVIDVSEDDTHAYVTLESGKTIKADLLLAADGILSRLRPKIIPNSPGPKIGSVALHQVFLHGSGMKQHEETKAIVEDSELNVWTSNKGYAVLRYHPALHLFAGIFSVTVPEGEDTKLWDEDGDIEFLRENYKNHHPTLKKILEISKACDRWRLGEVPDLPTWRSKGGRLVLLGDSAHGMFPDAAQGFSMIVEDVAVLSYLLSKKEIDLSVSEVTRLWEEVRMPRVRRIKEWARTNHQIYSQGHESKENRGATEESAKTVSLKDLEPDREADFMSPAFLKWAWGYDAVAEMKEYAKKQHAE